jgi:two-component system, sensor histidine kinase PdtaS
MLSLLKSVRGWPLWLRCAIVLAGIVGTYFGQLPIEADVPGDPFLLFLLIVLVTTVAFGQSLGLCAAAATAVLSTHFFEPGRTLHIHHAADLVKVELYLVLACLSALATAHLVRIFIEAYDATARLAERESRSSLMLGELSHRVANNFATVASLMRRHAAGIADPQAKSALDQAVNQVTVMARIHRRLHAGGDDAMVDSERFILELCVDLEEALTAKSRITLRCRACNLALPLAQAVPLGLIVNELVTNASKYAFADGRLGTISVELVRDGQQLRLTVTDDGIGMAGANGRSGAGSLLIGALSQQLGGRLRTNATQPGTRVSVEFPLPTPIRRQRLATIVN